MPYTNSIENIQKKCPPTERLGLLTKKDLHNVSRDFEVDESILHAEDAVSVGLQIKKIGGVTVIGLHAVSPITQAQKIIKNDNSLSLHFHSSTIKQRKKTRPTDD
ncbi:hypothetical protein TNCV_1783211 [Trichonephila clavipes]|nr:hypothetical protein TNCV_1783211 [Trichonephila clavipes]